MIKRTAGLRRTNIQIFVSCALLILLCLPKLSSGFQPTPPIKSSAIQIQRRSLITATTTTTTTTLSGYKFGDITKGLITQVTGKKEYEFGDLTRWLDQRAKTSVANFTNKTASEYQFGDITRELIRRFQSREYTMDDIMLVIKIVAFAGLNFVPIAKILPGKVLIDILEVSIAQTMGEKVVGTITTELDQRMKEMVTGDKDYQFGDITKKALTGDKSYKFGDITRQALLGKKDYEFGDITKAAISKFSGKGGKDLSATSKTDIDENQADQTRQQIKAIAPDQQTLDKLEEWDKKFLKAENNDIQEETSNQALADYQIQKWDEQLRQTPLQQEATINTTEDERPSSSKE